MKNLTLSIQREFFEDILNGSKKKEYREIRPTNIGTYIELEENGDPKFKNETDLDMVPVKYHTITLYTGQFKGKRPGVVVECLGAKTEIHKHQVYEYNGEEYHPAFITYKLGKIIEKLNFENLKPLQNTTYDRAQIVKDIFKKKREGKL